MQVSQQELGHKLKGSLKKGEGPNWSQMWQLLQNVTAQQQQQRDDRVLAAGDDTAAQFDRYVRESEGVALTLPPYPGTPTPGL